MKTMETKSTKKITGLLALLFAIASFSMFAQHSASDTIETRNLKLAYLVKQQPYIFVGKLISSKDFKSTEGVYYSSNLFEVDNVISGNLQKGTVEIIEKKYNYVDDKGETHRAFDGHSFIYNGTTIYICSDSKFTGLSSGTSNTNAKSLSIIDGTAFSNDKITQHDHYSVFNWFKNMNEFYNELSNTYGIKVDKSLLEKKSPINTTITKTTSKPYSEWLKDALKLKQNKINYKTSSFGCTELFISEYLDGQGSDNAVEIYNPTSSAISLSNYKLLIYHNASNTPTTIALTGTISAYGTHIVAEQGASSYILSHANQTTNNLNFNGDVCTVLNKGTIHIDKIGEIGVANASGSWTLTPSGGTNNSDIRRKYNIAQGDTNWTNCKSEWLVFSEDSVHNLGSHSNICGVDPDLNYTFANPQIIGNTFQFDIMAASVGANTYLDESAFDMTYNSTVFGTHAVMNNRVTVTLGTNFSDTTNTYYNPQLALGDGQDSISIIFRTKYGTGTWNRYLVTSTPVQLLHISFQIVNCGGTVDFQFFNTSFTGSFFTDYVANANDDPSTAPAINYTNVNYPTSALNTNIPACMQITDFNSPVIAGVGNTLTIVGNGFGTTRGNGQVKFTNADDGGTTHLHGINANDYISWSDTQIKINLPSFADTLNHIDSTIIGGGIFIVTNNSGQSAFSGLNMAGSSFSIYFSLLEWRNISTHNKNRVNLREQDTSGGYILRLNPTDFPVGSPQRIVFTKAVHDWVCITGANLEIGKDTTITAANPVMNDGVSYVFFGSTPLLAGTQPFTEYCSTDVTSLKEADMVFNNNLSPYSFAYDTNTTHNIPANQYDFYETCTHELGHYLGLEHNVSTSDLMYPYETTGNSSSIRKHLVVSTAPADGGTYSFNHSVIVLSNPANCWVAMTTGKCSSPFSGIEQYQVGNVNLFPNPTTSTIKIQSTNSLGTISVYNTLGQLITQQTTKDNNTEIDLSNQASGFYVIKIGNSNIKVIKQ
jgi:hypothetical protein